ncbi:phenylacetate-CoA ligase [Nonlabens dokdonensis]|uniref:Phenylacetate-CoA ligase n=2 Tax=Nonlabens dokdonensis TaxID=328515 RepID=A0ABX5Q2D1_9FLAO|nr:phenylacetate--CoA ligase family protein [Nonlabens dokdonensis]AGC76496.1 putative capsular polysaccharide biosynthesis protein [Nonlabens dokdonensis DSW-6]PZX44150.1 phenylacetate-CoA ligase [Nonlabens dokdonensis]
MPLQLFHKTLKLQGFKIDQARNEFTAISIHDIEKRKQKILKHHFTSNHFYNSLVTNKKANWNELPVLSKKDFQQPLYKRLSKGFTLKNVFKGKTSGSSGHPFMFAKDKYAHAMTWAAFHEAYMQHGINLNTSLQARFYGIPLSGKGRYLELIKDFISYRKRFPIFNMNDEVLERFVNQFTKTKFDYINGYTSSIVLLANYCKRKNLILKGVCPSLKICIVTSEMLFPDDRLLLEEWLGIPVVNEYGASEIGLIAMQNSKGDFEVNQQNLFVEIVDENNQPLQDGVVGRILITDLFNKAHPMIRYEIGDLGSLETLENGTRILKELQGRTSDIARLPSGKVIPGLTFYYVTKKIIKDEIEILEFVVIQKKPSLFEIQYVSSTDMDERLKIDIQKAMDEYLEPGLKVKFTRLAVLDRSKRGKLKQFMSEVK